MFVRAELIFLTAGRGRKNDSRKTVGRDVWRVRKYGRGGTKNEEI